MTDADNRTRFANVAQGYGALVAILLLLVAAIAFLPMLNLIADAPAVVTEADIARLQSMDAVAGSAESAHPAFSRSGGRRGGGSPCTRDKGVYGLATLLHLPKSQLLRLEYSLVTDCRLRLS